MSTPVVGSQAEWPVAHLGPLRRAKVLASAYPSAVWVEGTLDAPYERVWPFVIDFASSVPRFDTSVKRIAVHHRTPQPDGSERVGLTASALGVPLPFDVRVEDGFCLMEGWRRVYLVVMAAVPEPGDPDRTRFVHVEAIPRRGTRLARPFVGREVRSDLRNLQRLAPDL